MPVSWPYECSWAVKLWKYTNVVGTRRVKIGVRFQVAIQTFIANI